MSSTAIVTANKKTPRTATGRGGGGAAPAPTLLCNLCQKPLATTCFLCACDCIFCEECTYSHFEQSSNCPTCGRVLSEQDFTELVVADASSTSSSDIVKTSLQALFSKHSKSSSSATATKALPFSDLCFSLVRQIDVVKQSTKFILKQLLMESSGANRRYLGLHRSYEHLKNEVTQLKQLHSSQRLQLEQVNNDLQNRLQAREQANADLSKKVREQEKMLDQFRRLHAGVAVGSSNGDNSRAVGGGGGGGGGRGMVPMSRSGSRGLMESSRGSTGRSMHQQPQQQQQPPPLQGLIAQKQQQQQQSYARRQPNILGGGRGMMASSQGVPPPMRNTMSGGAGGGGGAAVLMHQQQQQQPMLAAAHRPYSSNSSGSLPSTPRIRDLSSSSGYTFTSSAAAGHHLNKRRRGGGGTPHTNGSMSPSTAFTLNQGPHSLGGGGGGGGGAQRWMQQSRSGYHNGRR